MRHSWFYSKLFFITFIGFFVAYALFSGGRFLYFHQAGVGLAAVPRQNEYTVGAGKPAYQVLVAGDSTAHGTGSSDYTQTYHYQYLSQQPGSFRVQNVGTIGARISDVAEQLNTMTQVDLLFISISGNDVTHFTRLHDLSIQLDELLTLAESKADTVILVTPGSMGDVGLLPWPIRVILGQRSSQVSALTKQVSSQHNVIQVDMFSHPESSFAQDPKTYFAADLFHPSNAGYMLWASAIATDVEKTGGLKL